MKHNSDLRYNRFFLGVVILFTLSVSCGKKRDHNENDLNTITQQNQKIQDNEKLQKKYGDVLNSIEAINNRTDLIDLTTSDLFNFDLRYATENNFMGVNLYGPFQKCYLHSIAAEKIEKAAALLSAKKPGYRLLLLDCLRPRSVQRLLYKTVQGTPQQGFVGNPDKGSIHNFGFAIDLTIADESGKEIDMGTPFDYFQPLARPDKEKEYLTSGELTQTQHENRLLLRSVMLEAGFSMINNEWWHFNALSAKEVRASYQIVE